MKKFMVSVAIIFIVSGGSSLSYGNEFNGKLGTSYAREAEKLGLDISLNYFFNLDPFFGVGLEGDFFWLKWDRKLGEEDIGQTSASYKAVTNAYVIPFFFNAQVKLPNLKEIVTVEPSLIVGLGYSMMILDDSIPEYVDNNSVTHSKEDQVNFYAGFAWQVMLSFSLQPSRESNVQFTFDAGYRGVNPAKEGIEFNMSGLVARMGVKMEI